MTEEPAQMESALTETALADELDRAGIERPADRAYEGIRRAILSGLLPGGTHLREEALAQMTGTSRTPVREALRRIVGEGLAHDEGRSSFVAQFPFEEVAIIFDIRARLEGYAAFVAAERITDAELQGLAQIIEGRDGPGCDPPLCRVEHRFSHRDHQRHPLPTDAQPVGARHLDAAGNDQAIRLVAAGEHLSLEPTAPRPSGRAGGT